MMPILVFVLDNQMWNCCCFTILLIISLPRLWSLQLTLLNSPWTLNLSFLFFHEFSFDPVPRLSSLCILPSTLYLETEFDGWKKTSPIRLMVVSLPCSAGFVVIDRRCTTSFNGVSNNDSFRHLATTLNFSPSHVFRDWVSLNTLICHFLPLLILFSRLFFFNILKFSIFPPPIIF